MHREDDDAGRGRTDTDLAKYLQPVHTGHLEIDDQNIRAEPQGERKPGNPVGGFAVYLPVCFGVKGGTQTTAYHRMIINEHDSCHNMGSPFGDMSTP